MNELLIVGWTWYPSVVIGFSAWTVLYAIAIKRGSVKMPLMQQIAFHAGTLVGMIALVSPLDKLGDEYLFSAHMIQHLLLMFITAPLWLIGTPGWLVDRIIPKRLDSLIKRLANPMSAFVAFVGVLLLWHIPRIYEMAQASEGIHISEHLMFIGAALIGWWPIVGADTSRVPKPEPLIRMLYIFLLAIPCTALAAILTFANAPLYLSYVTAPHPFGLNALQDQHLGGLLMWVPTHMFLLLMLGFTFAKWFTDSEHQAEQNYIKSLS